jgi:hypothetical protein
MKDGSSRRAILVLLVATTWLPLALSVGSYVSQAVAFFHAADAIYCIAAFVSVGCLRLVLSVLGKASERTRIVSSFGALLVGAAGYVVPFLRR